MRTVLLLLFLALAPCRSYAADQTWSVMIVEPGHWSWTVVGGTASVTLTDTEISFMIQGTTNEYIDGKHFQGRIRKEGHQIKVYDVQSPDMPTGTGTGRPYEGTIDQIDPQTIEGERARSHMEHIHLINEFRFIGLKRYVEDQTNGLGHR